MHTPLIVFFDFLFIYKVSQFDAQEIYLFYLTFSESPAIISTVSRNIGHQLKLNRCTLKEKGNLENGLGDIDRWVNPAGTEKFLYLQ